jgi:hypothetical protein
MATSKSKQVVDEPIKVIVPTPPKWIVGECADAGVRVVHVAASYYRRTDEGTQVCGTATNGEPDGNWKAIADADLPIKARSMLSI